LFLAALGVIPGVLVSSKKRTQNPDGKTNWAVWSGFLGLFTVGIVLGVFNFPEAFALSFTSLGTLMATKAGQVLDPRVRRYLASQTHGIVKAWLLEETTDARKRRREAMRKARKRRRIIFNILDRCHVEGAANLRAQVNLVVNQELPGLFARRPQVRKALAKTKAVLKRDEQFPSKRLSDTVRERTRADRDYFKEELEEINDCIRMFLRMLDHMSSEATKLRLVDNDVDPNQVRDWIDRMISEFDKMLEVQDELNELDRNGTATTSLSVVRGGSSTESTEAQQQQARPTPQRVHNGE